MNHNRSFSRSQCRSPKNQPKAILSSPQVLPTNPASHLTFNSFSSFDEEFHEAISKRKDLEYCIRVEEALYYERIREDSRGKSNIAKLCLYPLILSNSENERNSSFYTQQSDQKSSQSNHSKIRKQLNASNKRENIIQIEDDNQQYEEEDIINEIHNDINDLNDSQDFCEIIEPPNYVFQSPIPIETTTSKQIIEPFVQQKVQKGIQKKQVAQDHSFKRKININILSNDSESIRSDIFSSDDPSKLKKLKSNEQSSKAVTATQLHSTSQFSLKPKHLFKNTISTSQHQITTSHQILQRTLMDNAFKNTTSPPPIFYSSFSPAQFNTKKNSSSSSFELKKIPPYQQQKKNSKNSTATPLPPLLPILQASNNFCLSSPLPPPLPFPKIQTNPQIIDKPSQVAVEDEIENISFEERLCRIAQESEDRMNQEFIEKKREVIHARQALLAQQIKKFYSAKHSPNEHSRVNPTLPGKPKLQPPPTPLPVVPKSVLDLLNQLISSPSESEENQILIESDTDISIESTEPKHSHDSEHFELSHPTISKKIHSHCITELIFFATNDLASAAGTGRYLTVISDLQTTSKYNEPKIFSVDLADETIAQISGYAEMLFCVARQNYLLIFEKTNDCDSEQGLVLTEVLESCHVFSIEAYIYIPTQKAIVTAGQRQIRYWSKNPTTCKMENIWTSEIRPSDNLLMAYDAISNELLYTTPSHIICQGKLSQLGIGKNTMYEIPIMNSSAAATSTTISQIPSTQQLQLESMQVISLKHYKRVLITVYKSEKTGVISSYKLPNSTKSDSQKTTSPIKMWKFSESLCSFIVLCSEKTSNSSQILLLNHHLQPLRNLTTLDTQFGALTAISDSLIISFDLKTQTRPGEPDKLALGYENGLVQIFPLIPKQNA